MESKIYVGSGKEITTQFGKMLKISFSEKDLQTLADNKNEKGYVNLVVSERKTAGKFGETHSLIIDTWKPDGSKQEKPKNRIQEEQIDIDSIPF